MWRISIFFMGNIILNMDKVGIVQDKTLIFKEINLKINYGEFVYLIGKTGTGKKQFYESFVRGARPYARKM